MKVPREIEIKKKSLRLEIKMPVLLKKIAMAKMPQIVSARYHVVSGVEMCGLRWPTRQSGCRSLNPDGVIHSSAVFPWKLGGMEQNREEIIVRDKFLAAVSPGISRG